MKTLLFSLLLFFPVMIRAQSGNIILVEDSGVQKVLKLYQYFATEKRAVNGFRLQLSSSSNRTSVMDMKATFTQQYPEVNCYVTYQQPQFKLRIGDFEKRAEANKFLEEIKSNFPTAFVVPDKILLKGIPW